MEKPNKEQARKMLDAAYSDSIGEIAQTEISDSEIGKIEIEIDEIGDDMFFLDANLCPDTYDLETDWATGPCVIGESGGGTTRTVVYINGLSSMGQKK